jgi:hypothetical protein
MIQALVVAKPMTMKAVIESIPSHFIFISPPMTLVKDQTMSSMGRKKVVIVRKQSRAQCINLSTETVECAALSLQSIDNVERGDRLALGVLGVCDSIANDAFKEGLEDTASLFVDHC